MDPLQLTVYIFMYLNNLARDGNVTYEDKSWTFSDNIVGTLSLSNIILNGFDSMTVDISNIVVTGIEDGSNTVCVHLPIGNLNISLDYVVDIGVDNEIPIYGDGIFFFPMTNIEVDLCLFVNHDEVYINDVVFQSVYRHDRIQLTGFWNHREVSLILTNVLNILNRFIAMWSTYEPERASCLTTPFVSYNLNQWYGNENYTLDFDPSCWKEIFFDDKDYDQVLDVENHILERITNLHGNDAETNILTEENKLLILPIIKHLSNFALKLL